MLRRNPIELRYFSQNIMKKSERAGPLFIEVGRNQSHQIENNEIRAIQALKT